MLVVLYFGIKSFFLLYYYNINVITTDSYNDFISGLKISDTMTIDKVSIDSKDYLSFKNIKVKNEFSDFKVLEDQVSSDSIKYVLNDSENNIKASFWMGVTDSYVDLIKSDYTLFGTGNNRISNTDLASVLDKNNINNDIELFKFLEKSKNIKNSIFTPLKKMKENYELQFITVVVMPSIDSITLIDGDYEGYIFNLQFGSESFKGMREVRIMYQGSVYVFTFLNTEYFNNTYINEILNTVVIDSKGK